MIPNPPPRPSRSPGWLAGAIATLVATLMAVWLVGVAANPRSVTATWLAALTEREAPPADDASSREWLDWARRAVNDELKAQSAALVAADENAFLAAIDPNNADLLANHLRRFRVLHEMGVGQWEQAVTGPLESDGARSWKASVRVSYCFGAADCRAASVVVDSVWAFRNDHLILTQLDPTPARQNGPRPWEVADLVVATGERVIVAAPQLQAWRLPEAVAAADQAAAVADTFAAFRDPPSRYVIFMAGSTDWAEWYGEEQPEWAAGVSIGNSAAEVMVNVKVVPQSGLTVLLTHELTHVTSLTGRRANAGYARSWWLEEGIAEYAAMLDRPVSDYDALPQTGDFARSTWNGDPVVDRPTADATQTDAAGRYGVAFLAVRRIADQHGREKMIDFFGRVVHDGQSFEQAATAALGTTWDVVRADCADFIYSVT